jgi:hypothetical protein
VIAFASEMRMRFRSVVLTLLAAATAITPAQSVAPLVYRIRVPAPETHVAEIKMSVPAGGQKSVELMLPN